MDLTIFSVSLHTWQYLYWLTGAITVCYGLHRFFIPNSSISAWWFFDEKKIVAVERLHMGQVWVRCQKVKFR